MAASHLLIVPCCECIDVRRELAWRGWILQLHYYTYILPPCADCVYRLCIDRCSSCNLRGERRSPRPKIDPRQSQLSKQTPPFASNELTSLWETKGPNKDLLNKNHGDSERLRPSQRGITSGHCAHLIMSKVMEGRRRRVRAAILKNHVDRDHSAPTVSWTKREPQELFFFHITVHEPGGKKTKQVGLSHMHTAWVVFFYFLLFLFFQVRLGVTSFWLWIMIYLLKHAHTFQLQLFIPHFIFLSFLCIVCSRHSLCIVCIYLWLP